MKRSSQWGQRVQIVLQWWGDLGSAPPPALQERTEQTANRWLFLRTSENWNCRANKAPKACGETDAGATKNLAVFNLEQMSPVAVYTGNEIQLWIVNCGTEPECGEACEGSAGTAGVCTSTPSAVSAASVRVGSAAAAAQDASEERGTHPVGPLHELWIGVVLR